MICPYIIHIQQTQVIERIIDENGMAPRETLHLGEVHIPLECQRENCGAWHDGRCCYGAEA